MPCSLRRRAMRSPKAMKNSRSSLVMLMENGVRPRFCKGNQNCSLKHVNGGLTLFYFQAGDFVGFRYSMERSTVVFAISSKCHTARIFARSGLGSRSLQLSVVAEALSSKLEV